VLRDGGDEAQMAHLDRAGKLGRRHAECSYEWDTS
jgi:hypothetical protein